MRSSSSFVKLLPLSASNSQKTPPASPVKDTRLAQNEEPEPGGKKEPSRPRITCVITSPSDENSYSVVGKTRNKLHAPRETQSNCTSLSRSTSLKRQRDDDSLLRPCLDFHKMREVNAVISYIFIII